MNKLDALRYFCVASETLNFRDTAQRLAVSPQVVTRVIAELEQQFGEPLFKRNTRNIKLTEFGSQLLPQARQLLADSDRLFNSIKPNKKAMQGRVRVTLPPLPENAQILSQLMLSLSPYPDLTLDWQVSLDKLKKVNDQIDIGIRICLEPEPDWVAQHITTLHEKIVASPEWIKRYGFPENLQMLEKMPISALVNYQTGKIWHWQINYQKQLIPQNPKLVTNDMFSELQSALSGQTCSQIINLLSEPYIKQGKLVELFADIPKLPWQLYLYRPYQQILPERINFVYQQLGQILLQVFRHHS